MAENISGVTTDELRSLRNEVAKLRRAASQLQEKQHFLEQMLNTQEQDRRLVAYEIHDTFLQDVIAALMFETEC